MHSSESSTDARARPDQDCHNSNTLKACQQTPSLSCDLPHTVKTQNVVHLLLGRCNQAITGSHSAEDSRDLVLK